MAIKSNRQPATAAQKENFKNRFAQIVCHNDSLNNHYTIQFFETAQKSNFAFSSLDGRSLNVLSLMTLEEADLYRQLKSSWQE